MSWLVRAAWIAATGTIVASSIGCDSSGGLSPAETSTKSTHPAYRPVYAMAKCTEGRFEGLRLPPDVDCGTLTVPEDRSDPAGRQVRLAVLTYPPLRYDDDAPATVYLSGGPGDSALGIPWEQRAFPAAGPLVVLDQRGTGRSSPSLECPEVDEMRWRAMAAGTTPAERSADEEAAFDRCRGRLATIANLDQYDTPAMAQDAEDLRRAMGLGPWNLFGLSYGTSVALELLRTHPDGVRSAVLDSVVPPGRDYGAPAEARRVDAAFGRLVAACDQSASCRAAHPDLLASLLAIRTTLNADPHEVRFTDAAGADRTARLTGDDVVSGVFQAMYDSTLIPLLPGFIDTIANGELGVLSAVGAPLLASAALNADGVARSVVCADRQRLASHDDADALRESHPLAALRVDGDGCGRWKVMSVPAAVNTTPRTRVPTLVLAGELDPVTPAVDAHRLTQGLGPTSTYVSFPSFGHGILSAAENCPASIANAFLVSPSRPVDQGCVGSLGPPIRNEYVAAGPQAAGRARGPASTPPPTPERSQRRGRSRAAASPSPRRVNPRMPQPWTLRSSTHSDVDLLGHDHVGSRTEAIPSARGWERGELLAVLQKRRTSVVARVAAGGDW